MRWFRSFNFEVLDSMADIIFLFNNLKKCTKSSCAYLYRLLGVNKNVFFKKKKKNSNLHWQIYCVYTLVIKINIIIPHIVLRHSSISLLCCNLTWSIKLNTGLMLKLDTFKKSVCIIFHRELLQLKFDPYRHKPSNDLQPHLRPIFIVLYYPDMNSGKSNQVNIWWID